MRTARPIMCWIVFVLFISLVLSLPVGMLSGKVWAAASEKQLVEGAKQEGRLVWYTTMTTESNEAVRQAFVKKYPFIKMEVLRTPNPKLLARIVNEARAGKYLWDALSIAGFHTYIIKKKNFLASYTPPGAKYVPDRFKDPEGYWHTVYLNPLITGYNTTLVRPSEVPKSYDDLLDPKWKGRMALDSKDVEWFANFLKVKGEQQGMAYMEKLAEQDLRLVSGHSLGAQLLAAAEFSIGISLYPFRLELMKSEGAPIDWVALDPTIAYLYPASISAKAPHPNAARLLINYLFSKEGQELVAKFGRNTARSDVYPRFPKMRIEDKFTPSDITMADDYNRYTKLYRKIFFKGRR